MLRLAVKFGESLKLNETLYDFIRQTKAANTVRSFDFEPSLDEAETLTSAKELIFYMHWLKLRGRPAQLVPPNLGFKKRQAYPETAAALAAYAHLQDVAGAGTAWRNPLDELAGRVKELAGVARHFQGTLSIHSGSGKQAAVLELIGKATLGPRELQDLRRAAAPALRRAGGAACRFAMARAVRSHGGARQRFCRAERIRRRKRARAGVSGQPRRVPWRRRQRAAWTAISSWSSGWATWSAAGM